MPAAKVSLTPALYRGRAFGLVRSPVRHRKVTQHSLGECRDDAACCRSTSRYVSDQAISWFAGIHHPSIGCGAGWRTNHQESSARQSGWLSADQKRGLTPQTALYTVEIHQYLKIYWCPVRESNPRPSLYKSAALASELTGQSGGDVATGATRCKGSARASGRGFHAPAGPRPKGPAPPPPAPPGPPRPVAQDWPVRKPGWTAC